MGAGAELRVPLGIAIVGGLIVSVEKLDLKRLAGKISQ
jgi:hypothetical protein